MTGEFTFVNFFTKSREIWNDSSESQSRSSSQVTDIIIFANHMPWQTQVGVSGMPKFTDEKPETQNLIVC